LAPKSSTITSPTHYTFGTRQVWDWIVDVIVHYESDEGYHVGNVFKYLCRAPLKGNKVKDLKKAREYITNLIERIEAKEAQKHLVDEFLGHAAPIERRREEFDDEYPEPADLYDPWNTKGKSNA
jgi:hypothetical protein